MRKHILIVSQYFYPEQFRINDLASEWVKRKYKVTVITGIPNYPQGKFFVGYGLLKKRYETYNGVEIVRIPLIPRGNSSVGITLNYFSFIVSGFFWKCFTKIKADYTFIFEVSPMTQALVGVWYANRRKIPCFLYVQDLWPENVEIAAGIHNKWILGPIGKMVDFIYKRCNKIFVASPSFAESVKARGTDENKVVYWSQYAEEFYKPCMDKSPLIPTDGIINITFTGNIGTAQGLEILPEAAEILKGKNISLRFNIIGDGRNKENLINQIKAKQVEEYFNLIGWQPAENIPSILAASDAAFLSFADNPLYSMTIPAKLQSYMACGIPIIGSVSGESEKIIRESECGLTCKIGSASALSDVIIEFIQLSQSKKREMAENANAYTQKHFNKKTLIDYIDKYYKE